MSQVNTYSVQQVVVLVKDSNPVEEMPIHSGVPENNTIALSSWHSYKSFAWFDTETMASDMHNRRVTKVSVSLTAQNQGDAESAGYVPIRTYMTNVKYDSSKTGHINADTKNPASGMTYSEPTNEWFEQYWFTEAVSKNGTLTNSQLCAGSDAADLVASLCEGNALGFFDIPDATSITGSYHYRIITSLSITVYSEALIDVTKPTEVTVLDTDVHANSQVRIHVSGAEETAVNPITGYYIRKRYQLTQTGDWSNWSNSDFYELADTEGIVSTTVNIPGAKWAFAVATTSDLNTTDYVDATGYTEVFSKDRNKVCLFDLSAGDYTTNGIAVLKPTVCTVTEQAGGSYELSMTHPLDPEGLWRRIQNGFLLKARVPVARAEQTISGDVEIWKNSSSSARDVYAKAIGKQVVTYTAFSFVSNYSQGDKVTLFGKNNYQCLRTYPINADNAWRAAHRPDYSTDYWKEIDRYKSGSSTLTSVAPEQEFYKSEDYSATWLRVTTYDGIEGYIERQYCEYVRTESVPAVNPAKAKEQLFRVYQTQVDTKNHKITVSARHVSYDLSGNICQECVVKNQAPATAIAMIRNSLYEDELNTISTNLTEDDGTISQDYSWKSPVKALLDPDSGVLGACRAKLIRDNWDIFVMKNTEIDRGVVLAYGKNLRGVTWKQSADQLVTRVIPFAKKADGTDLFLDDVAVDSPLIDSYPVIYTERLQVDGKVGQDDGSGENWTTETLKAHMQEKAEQRFSIDHADAQTVTLTVDFVMLGDTEEYKQYRGLQSVYMYDMVRVHDERIGLDRSIQVSKVEWDVINQRYNKITLGDTFDYGGRTVSGYSIANGGIDFDKINPSAIDKIRNG